MEYYQQALTISRETGNRDGEATAVSSLASRYATLGQTETAIEHYQQALTIDREIGNRDGEAFDLTGLGSRYASLGQTETSMEHYQQALTISRETGNRSREADALSSLADGYADLGQTETAIEHYQQALAIYRETGNGNAARTRRQVPCRSTGRSPQSGRPRRAPEMPRTAINSQRSPPAATWEHEARATLEPASNTREHPRNA